MNINLLNLSYFGRSLAVQKLKAIADHCIDSFVEATSLHKSFEGPEGPATFWWLSSSGWFQMGLLQGHGFKVTPQRGTRWPSMIMIAGVKAVDENLKKHRRLEQIFSNTEYTESDWTWTWSSENCDLHGVLTSFHVHSRGYWLSSMTPMALYWEGHGRTTHEWSTQTAKEHTRDG